jgi:phage shock protein E
MRTLLALSLLLAAACDRPAAPMPPTRPAPPTVATAEPTMVLGEEARALVAAGATLLDVRTVDEFQELHIEGARNVPLNELGGAMASLPKDKPVIVYCAVGARATTAAGLLARAGFQVRNLGAMANWNR